MSRTLNPFWSISRTWLSGVRPYATEARPAKRSGASIPDELYCAAQVETWSVARSGTMSGLCYLKVLNSGTGLVRCLDAGKVFFGLPRKVQSPPQLKRPDDFYGDAGPSNQA